MFLDGQLTFEEHLEVITTKVNKTTIIIQKLQTVLQRLVLMTIYKAFVKLQIDYGDVIYNEAYNETFNQKLELFNIIPA